MKCDNCDGVAVPGGKYCPRCRKFTDVPREGKDRAAALKRAWRPGEGGFVCKYTGVLLDETDAKSPWYLTFDHRMPHGKGELDVVAAFIKSMKTDMTEEEFVKVVVALGKRFEGRFDRETVKLDNWVKAVRPVRQ